MASNPWSDQWSSSPSWSQDWGQGYDTWGTAAAGPQRDPWGSKPRNARVKPKARAQAPAYLEDGTCEQCAAQSAGWRDRRGSFYCQSCWRPYESSKAEHARPDQGRKPGATNQRHDATANQENYEGKAYHDEIIDAEQLAAEHDEHSTEAVLAKLLAQHSQALESDAACAVEEEEEDEFVAPLPCNCGIYDDISIPLIATQCLIGFLCISQQWPRHFLPKQTILGTSVSISATGACHRDVRYIWLHAR